MLSFTAFTERPPSSIIHTKADARELRLLLIAIMMYEDIFYEVAQMSVQTSNTPMNPLMLARIRAWQKRYEAEAAYDHVDWLMEQSIKRRSEAAKRGTEDGERKKELCRIEQEECEARERNFLQNVAELAEMHERDLLRAEYISSPAYRISQLRGCERELAQFWRAIEIDRFRFGPYPSLWSVIYTYGQITGTKLSLNQARRMRRIVRQLAKPGGIWAA
jgi:hypothetical protein